MKVLTVLSTSFKCSHYILFLPDVKLDFSRFLQLGEFPVVLGVFIFPPSDPDPSVSICAAEESLNSFMHFVN